MTMCIMSAVHDEFANTNFNYRWFIVPVDVVIGWIGHAWQFFVFELPKRTNLSFLALTCLDFSFKI